MRRIKKIILTILCQIAVIVVAITFLRCEHKEFLNPYDPENFPPAPSLLLPANDTTSPQNPPYFQWEVEEDTLNPLYGEELVFELQIDNSQDFSSAAFIDSNIAYKIFIPSTNFGEGNHFWRVRAKYPSGGWGDWSEIQKFNVRFPIIGSYDIYNQNNIAIKNNFAFLAHNHDLNIIDISNPYNPNLISTFSDTIIDFDYIFISNNCLYTTDNGSGNFSIYDITNPANPVLLDRFEFTPYYDPMDLWVENEKAYICSDNYYNILVFNISNPESVFIVDSLPVSGGKIIVENNYGYILQPYTMVVIDLATNLIISSENLNGRAWVFWISGNYAFIAGYDTWIYDISDPYNPCLISTINNESYTISASNNYLFFTSYTGEYSLLIYDITDPLNPKELGTVHNIYGEIFSNNNFVYTCGLLFSIIKYE